MINFVLKAALTAGVGGLGVFIGQQVGLPSPWLLGAMGAVILAIIIALPPPPPDIFA